jgi:ATPase subunit of ABC transporter with duplicated ATPase domains
MGLARRAAAAVRWSRLRRRRARPAARTFSGGELTRASLAARSAGSPNLLLLD